MPGRQRDRDDENNGGGAGGNGGPPAGAGGGGGGGGGGDDSDDDDDGSDDNGDDDDDGGEDDDGQNEDEDGGDEDEDEEGEAEDEEGLDEEDDPFEQDEEQEDELAEEFAGDAQNDDEAPHVEQQENHEDDDEDDEEEPEEFSEPLHDYPQQPSKPSKRPNDEVKMPHAHKDLHIDMPPLILEAHDDPLAEVAITYPPQGPLTNDPDFLGRFFDRIQQERQCLNRFTEHVYQSVIEALAELESIKARLGTVGSAREDILTEVERMSGPEALAWILDEARNDDMRQKSTVDEEFVEWDGEFNRRTGPGWEERSP